MPKPMTVAATTARPATPMEKRRRTFTGYATSIRLTHFIH